MTANVRDAPAMRDTVCRACGWPARVMRTSEPPDYVVTVHIAVSAPTGRRISEFDLCAGCANLAEPTPQAANVRKALYAEFRVVLG
jgi:hypothetical protein